VLDKHISSLSDYLMHPWFSTLKWQSFWSSINQLVESLYKYKTYLKSHCENVQERNEMDTFKPVEKCFRVLPISASANSTKK